MDLNIIGGFIKQERKAKGLTQVELAKILNVSEKTISKWECGNGFPDTSLMLPLCEALGVSANELLSGKRLDDGEYKTNAEENIVKLKAEQEMSTKLLLSLEWVVGIMGLIIALTPMFFASFVNIPTVWRVLLIVFGFIVLAVTVYFALKIERDAGYYECNKCKHRYIPKYSQVLWAMHFGRTRYMKCPKCNKTSWNKKVINK